MTHNGQAGVMPGAAAMEGGTASNFNKLQDHDSEIVYNSGSMGGGDHQLHQHHQNYPGHAAFAGFNQFNMQEALQNMLP